MYYLLQNKCFADGVYFYLFHKHQVTICQFAGAAKSPRDSLAICIRRENDDCELMAASDCQLTCRMYLYPQAFAELAHNFVIIARFLKLKQYDMVKTNLSLLAGAMLVLFSVSCVSSKKFKSLQADYSTLQGKANALAKANDDCQSGLGAANVKIAGLQDQLQAERSHVASLQSSLDKCLTSTSQGNVNISKLVDEINSSNKYIQQLIASKNKSDSLNMLLTNNLTRSLSRDEMQDVDVQVLKGVVYISLSDNMLYKSGSYEISDKSGATLAKIAKIITDYKDFEVLIEGNTDNVPITKSNIRNNWDLSALRASSVVQSLQNNFGVDPKRLTAGGRGEYNPIADNSTEAGKIKNRRTQIIITPKLDQFMELIDKAPASDSTGVK